MHWKTIMLACCLSAGLASPVAAAPMAPQLEGLSTSEATEVIGALKAAQAKLRAGEKPYFILLSGAAATNPMADVSPRDAFLGLPFDQVFRIKRLRAGARLWEVTVTPNGLGQQMWDIEVTTGWDGKIERVEMEYGPPPPF